MPSRSCLLLSCRLAAPLLALSPPSVRCELRGSAILHRHHGWRIPCLRLQPLSFGALPRPVDPAAPPWLLAPSSPPWPISPLAPPGSLVPQAPPWSVVDHPSPRDSTPPAAPRPFGSVRLLLPFGSSSVLCRSGSTAAFWIPISTSVAGSLSPPRAPPPPKYTRLQPADRGGAAPGAGLHVLPRPQCFSLVSGKVMTSTPR